MGEDLNYKNKYLVEVIKKLNIEKNVRLIGFKNEVDQYYKAFDLFCLTSSDSEGFQMF